MIVKSFIKKAKLLSVFGTSKKILPANYVHNEGDKCRRIKPCRMPVRTYPKERRGLESAPDLITLKIIGDGLDDPPAGLTVTEGIITRKPGLRALAA